MRALHLLPITLVGLIPFCACNKDKFEEQKEITSKVQIEISLDNSSKVTLDSARTAYRWEANDEISILNDKENQNVKLKVSESPYELEISDGAKTLYGVSPYKSYHSNGPAKVSISIPYSQTQDAGKLNGSLWSMWASSAIKDGKASLCFKSLVSAFAFNIYRSDGNSDKETLTGIKVIPQNNTGFAGDASIDLTAASPAFTKGNSSSTFVETRLNSPFLMAGSKPDAAKYAGQVYVVAAKTSYTGLKLEITTSKGTYTLYTKADFKYDLSATDFVVTGIDLAKLSVTVYYTSGTEEYKEIEITDKGNACLDSPTAYQDEEELDHDRIPDFSRVGYKYGDEPIPTYAVKKTISTTTVASLLSNGTYPDTTACIQAAIDEVGLSGGGAILIKEGEYHVHGTLFLDYNNTVIRGEGPDKTIIISDEKRKMATIFIGQSVPAAADRPDSLKFAGRTLGRSSLRGADQYNHFGDTYIVYFAPSGRGVAYGKSSAISENYAPVGRLYVEVEDASIFTPGDRIAIYRPHNNDWISDIGMDKIAKNGREGISSGTIQWNTENFERYFQRRITHIRNKRLYLDAPIVQALDAAYGSGTVYKLTAYKVSGSGVENLRLVSTVYKNASDPDSYYNKRWIDEKHSWYAVMTKAAEHCWISNVTSYHYGMSLASLGAGSKNITVQDCKCMEPVSIMNGGRRYAFNLSGAELCLIKDCLSDEDRHAFVTNISRGPNVFLRCTTSNFSGSIGPHQHWGTGDLYDNVSTAGTMEAYDRGNAGTGHGWAGANYVYWNCTAKQITIQSPWARENTPELETMAGGYTFHSAYPSARNYCIGFTGIRKEPLGSAYEHPYSGFPSAGISDYYVQLGFDGNAKLARPAAKWYPEPKPGTSGSTKVTLPDNAAAKAYDWWPKFSLTTFSHPESLYESQLEERHHRGIYLNNL